MAEFDEVQFTREVFESYQAELAAAQPSPDRALVELVRRAKLAYDEAVSEARQQEG